MAIKAAKLKELNQGVNSLKLNDFQNYKKSSSFFNLKDNINELNRNLNLNYKQYFKQLTDDINLKVILQLQVCLAKGQKVRCCF